MKRLIYLVIFSCVFFSVKYSNADEYQFLSRTNAVVGVQIIHESEVIRIYRSENNNWREFKPKVKIQHRINTKEYYIVINDYWVDPKYIYVKMHNYWVNLAAILDIKYDGQPEYLPNIERIN